MKPMVAPKAWPVGSVAAFDGNMPCGSSTCVTASDGCTLSKGEPPPVVPVVWAKAALEKINSAIGPTGKRKYMAALPFADLAANFSRTALSHKPQRVRE